MVGPLPYVVANVSVQIGNAFAPIYSVVNSYSAGMDAVTIHFAPTTGTEEEWNEAYARLADYFRSYRLHNRIRRTQLILETLRRAADAHEKDPQRLPTRHAIEQARAMMKEWLGEIYKGMELTQAQIEGSGRLGFHLCDGPGRWPHFFIDRDNLPEDMTEAMVPSITESSSSQR